MVARALRDPRDVPVSAPNAAALEALEPALTSLYSFRHDPVQLIDPVITQWPEFALAHIFRALALVELGETRFASAARRNLELAAPLLEAASERERRLHQAVHALIEGQWQAASDGFEQCLREYPTDVLSLHAGHSLDFLRGDATNLRNRLMRVLPAWRADMPGHPNVLAMYAFGLEESNQYAEAEQVGLAALDAEPCNPWAVHAVAHVMEMNGRVDDGIGHLESRRDDWSRDSGFAYHNWWHLALFYLDRDDSRTVLELYDRYIADPHAALALNKLDATALLWRLRLFNLPVADRWQPLRDWWAEQLEREAGHNPFHDFHAALAFAATGDHAALDALLQLADERTLSAATEQALASREIGLPLVRSIGSYARGNHLEAARALMDLRDRCRAFGGSHAQRDLVTLTLIDAAARAGDRRLAEHYLNERLVGKPASPLGWRLRERYLNQASSARP